MDKKTLKIAEFLVDSHLKDKNFKNLEGNLKPLNFDEAYDAQNYFQKLISRGELGGFKIALSSKIQQEHHKINQPVYGGIFKKEIFQSPKSVRLSDYKRLSVEFELAFELSEQIEDLKSGKQIGEIKNYISDVYPALELIEDRKAEYNGLDALSLACDNAWSGGLILGKKIKNWRELDFKKLISTCEWNDESLKSTSVMDADPFNNLNWLISQLIERKQVLTKGMLIITGSVFLVRQAKLGDSIRHSLFDDLQVELEII
tara:strand:+ start:394 stop:1170 length:777 start_codon:yes stop_codon:yes gene_type:complete